ncbi:hypothetical protein L1049_009901 [Liquidambar formosana]|uniref:VQ domain-containing protein n=1 Tax=Liquidambar formosana TaxID=63359 RepID=A0AAP0N6N5_LIQFO
MENSPRPQNNQNPSLIPSPNSHSTNSSASSSSSNSDGVHPLQPLPQQQQPPPPPPPKPITRSETNPYPTTFVQADTSSFKQVVQMLTGSSETAKQASSIKPTSDSPPTRNPIPPIKNIPKKQQGFKLYERRSSLKNIKLSPLVPGFVPYNSGFSPRKAEILSPSLLDFPGLVLSPVTPLMTDPFNRSPPQNASCCSANASLDSKAEEKAIAEKGFYLHPSPSTTPRDAEPRLLPLFPVTSPRVSGSSS